MAYSIASNTRLAGSSQGNFLDDLTNPNVGQWPKTQAIRKITNIVVYSGDIIDSIRITYDVENGGVVNPVTVQHGGNGGSQTLAFDIGADEKLVAVYGTRLVDGSPYGDRNIIQLSFVVVNSAGDAPTVQVYTASGIYSAPTEKFELSWPLTAASSYTFQPEGMGDAYLQAIGFSNALDKADAPLL
ncbi:hypothetical protein BJY52DRAFT_1265271 [Lactarius psammicola]|nr:hypothetical protein BJY52DRAFT_1265271 [Lactarius psammicola]